ncbi:NAD(P)/FAD-dependent oxidoreductase [Aquincola sp. S2]|uniref:NAD(P)/FAD-dependent oxidoreductase n=1 Tax=Pseudaquabacterium terrae TaxID=2732868 RepID=A0ABX2EP42_9BURK|nr:NAD(P)/FAD-dependent oxidoreductase [Aquabacterium terrae]NRF70444.1 NAD(P)/FAD-dependent oxidoreductase [Aquabacterium terrae]
MPTPAEPLPPTSARWDTIVIGAGAAGLFCAALAGQRGLKVLLLDHAEKLAEKIRISGGGRCNFTNRDAGPANFLSSNPDFCRSALARYTAADFIALVRRHGISFHEKHRGQLFCDGSSEQIIHMLVSECDSGGVERRQPCAVRAVRAIDGGFELDSDAGPLKTRQVVIATGGLSIPKIGATDFGYRIAKQFGHKLIEPRPALVPLTFDAAAWAPFVPLAGVSLEVAIETGQGRQRGPVAARGRDTGARFVEDLLFTHRGLSGPAVLQISSFWRPGDALRIDLGAGADLAARLREAKLSSRRQLGNELATWLPQRLASAWLDSHGLPAERAMPELRDRDLERLAQGLSRWTITPDGTEGFRKAEVTAGGVDTRELDSRTMASKRQPGLFFIGEVVDVTGWLGGYNFQWAWASAAACALGLAPAKISQ